ncbi:MAG: insulinase family protein [Acidobacteriota bacterium]
MSRRISLFLITLLLISPLAAQRGKPKQWEHETSDIPVNPRMHFGELPGGMRFAWMANSEPDQRCYLRLHVEVGSLMEEDSQQGMAHFLEHMAFNGLRNHPAGTLIEWFQRHGMSFGADTNAATGFESTVYNIDLPTSDQKSLREGLQVLRDFADGILLEPEEIEHEKGVIDAEQRERDSAGFRTFIKEIEIRYGGSRIPPRIPIGVAEVRRKFTAESTRAFYRKWYRPEHITLIIVGDLESLDPEPLMRNVFEGFEAPQEPLPQRPPVGYPDFEQRTYAIHEPEIPTAQMSVSLLRRWEEEADNAANRVKDLPLLAAHRLLNLRYSELAKAEGAAVLGASSGSEAAFEMVEGERLSVTSDPAKWKEALASAEQELRRALKYGFQQAELDEVRANFLRGLEEAVQREKTRSSLSYVRQLLGAAGSGGGVSSDARTNRRIFKPAIERLTPAQCRQAFLKAWEKGTQLLGLTGKADLGEKAPELLVSALEESRQVAVEPPDDISVAAFAYHSDPERIGKIVKRGHLEDFGLHQVEFENGVRINLKKTDFKEKQILIRGRLGEGLLTLAPSQSALSLVASQVFSASGLEAHSADDLRRIFAGKQVSVSFGVSQDHFSLRGSTTREDLVQECELMAAFLTSPGWRPEGMRQFKAFIPRFYDGLLHRHNGPLQAEFIPALYLGDPRFGLPSQQQVEAVTLDDLRQWLTPHLSQAPLEVTFVGDLEVEDVIQAAARTLGVLPKRRPLNPYPERRQAPAPRAGLEESYSIDTAVPKSLVYLAFPTTDGLKAATRRRLSFLSRVINDRLRVEIREKRGAAYSPFSSSQASQVFPGSGLMTIQVMSEPEKAQELKNALLQVADQLASKGTTQEEVDRLRQPILAQLRDAQRSNGFWLSNLDESQTRPELLDDLRGLIPFYESISAQDLNPLAQKYLTKERVSSAIVSPR